MLRVHEGVPCRAQRYRRQDRLHQDLHTIPSIVYQGDGPIILVVLMRGQVMKAAQYQWSRSDGWTPNLPDLTVEQHGIVFVFAPDR